VKKLNKNNIETYYHCKICINELQNSTSTKDLSMIDPKLSEYTPQTYARLEVGLTKQGFQVWCVRHNLNVIHIDFKGQEVDIETTKDIASEDANTWLAKGMELIKLEKYDEGIRCFNEVIRFEDVDHYALCGAWNEKGLACSHLEKNDDAISCYDEAIRIDPNYWNAWNNKGNSLKKLGRDEEAEQCFTKAEELDLNKS
jgi:tetratricopeptide (TPR) repeat protein